ncbi:MAG: hypothetical protein LBK60_01600 [Verrucomicrobiales bacterium]|nr:hypothetical protein [Verrucomicrobiales bacterium]
MGTRGESAEITATEKMDEGVTFAENTNRTMNHAVAMKLYNGASRVSNGFVDTAGPAPGFILNPQGSDHYCFWKNSANGWALSRFNALKFNYVRRVCSEVE